MSIPTLTLLTVREAADVLRISTRTLHSQTSPRGTIPCVRIGRSVRYSQAALQNWIDQQQEAKSSQNETGEVNR